MHTAPEQPAAYSTRLGLSLVPWQGGGVLLLYLLQYLCLVGGCVLLVGGLVAWNPWLTFAGLLVLRLYLFFGMAGETLLEKLSD